MYRVVLVLSFLHGLGLFASNVAQQISSIDVWANIDPEGLLYVQMMRNVVNETNSDRQIGCLHGLPFSSH